jgi:hypothetical protein
MTAPLPQPQNPDENSSSEPTHGTSSAEPSQLTAWWEFNWSGSDESGPDGEWLRCLKATREGDRQFIWSGDALRGIVTFSGWVRDCGGFYEGWASLARLARPVTRTQLLAHPVTRPRFQTKGIKALQGLPIRLQPDVASAIWNLAGGSTATQMPLDEPDYSEEPILWAGPHGLAPEAYVEAEVAASRSLWRRMGFSSAPDRQVTLGDAGRCDLIWGGVVGEVKRAVTLANGPDQIERYLSYLHFQERIPRSALKGVLIQCAATTNAAVVERLRSSDYDLELWTVDDEGDIWYLDRLA